MLGGKLDAKQRQLALDLAWDLTELAQEYKKKIIRPDYVEEIQDALVPFMQFMGSKSDYKGKEREAYTWIIDKMSPEDRDYLYRNAIKNGLSMPAMLLEIKKLLKNPAIYKKFPRKTPGFGFT